MFEDTFSRRYGYTPPPVQGEREELSQEARLRLWNIFYSDFCQPNTIRVPHSTDQDFTPLGKMFLRGVWTEFFHQRLDYYPGYSVVLGQIAEHFEKGIWHFPFDIWEGIFECQPPPVPVPDMSAANIREALARENTAYTFVGRRFVDRMRPEEVQSVEKVLRSPIEGIREHFTTALQFLSDRENPDYRNSIKESISAIEAACKHLCGSQKGDLNAALDRLHSQRPLHQALKNAISTLYGWTSDDSGIRHAIKDANKVERADAQFMLVTCSAFVNYLFER